MDSTHAPSARQGLLNFSLRALAWGEVFVLIPLHMFWIMFKSTPFAAENRAGLLMVVLPFAVAGIAGAAMQHRMLRDAFIRAEWLFHLTSAAIMTGLLVYVTIRDPFDPLLPMTWPLGVWSACLSFTILANLALHERTHDNGQARPAPWRWLGFSCVGLALWGILALLGAGMTWAPYFWTASAMYHAAVAPLSRRTLGSPLNPAPPVRRILAGLTGTFEGLMGAALMLTALLRFLFACDMLGAAEVRYPQVITLCASPWFLAGAVLAVLARRLRVPVVGHALALLAAFAADGSAHWVISFLMGYGLAVLFLTAMRKGALSCALLASATAFAWILGLYGFMLAGVIIVFEVGTALAEVLLARARMAAVLLWAVWLLVALLCRFVSRNQVTQIPHDAPPARRLGYAWVYVGAWLFVALPLAFLIRAYMWPPVFFDRLPRIPVGEASGICHAGYSESAEEYAVLHELGARATRIPIYWGRVERAPGQWDFSGYDGFLEEAGEHEMKVVAVLGYDNDAVEQSVTGSQRGGYIAPEDMPLFLGYVKRTVEQYKEHVYAWEIWNEPDLPHFWTGTMEEFYVIARHTAETLREVHPKARIIGTAMTSLLGLYSTPGIEGLHATGALEHVDHPAMHTYISDPRGFYGEFRRVQNAAKKYGHPGAVWVTELGAPDGGVYPWCVATGLRAEYAMKSYVISTAMGVERLFWHCFEDTSIDTKRRDPLNSEHFFGLVEADGRWKPAAHAYQLFAKYCNNSMLRHDLVRVSGGLAARQLRTVLYRRGDGQSALVLWFEPALRQGAQARVTLDLGDLDDVALIHDIASGCRKYLVDGLVDVSEKPLFITFTSPEPETLVRLAAASSPADKAWLLLVAGLLLVFAALSCRAANSRITP